MIHIGFGRWLGTPTISPPGVIPDVQHEKMIIDLRNNVNLSYGTHTTWVDSIFGHEYIPHLGSNGGTLATYSPTLTGEAINGAPSLIYGAASGDQDKNLMYNQGPIVNYGSLWDGYTMAAVFKNPTFVPEEYDGRPGTLYALFGVYPYGPPDYIPAFSVKLQGSSETEGLFYIDITCYDKAWMYDSINHRPTISWPSSSWHTLVVSVSHVLNMIYVIVDGVAIYSEPAGLASASGLGGYGFPIIGAHNYYYDDFLDPGGSFFGELAAVQAWKTALTQEECVEQCALLMNNYSLS
jgi:hypothetical protein